MEDWYHWLRPRKRTANEPLLRWMVSVLVSVLKHRGCGDSRETRWPIWSLKPKKPKAVTDMTSGFNTEQLSQVGRYEWLWYFFLFCCHFVMYALQSVLHTFFFLLMNVKTNSMVTSTGDGLVPPLNGAAKPVRQYKPGELQSLKAEAPYPMPPASK